MRMLTRLAILIGLPYATFWSLRMFVPFYPIPYTWRTVSAFWLLFWSAQWVWQNLRLGSPDDLFSRE